MSLENRVVIITGGSGGIGRELVKKFAAARAVVVYTYRQKNIEEELLQQWKEEYGACIEGYQLDITKGQQVREVIRKIAEHHTEISVLINNAGIRRDKTLLYMSEEEWEEVLQTNLTGTFWVTRTVIPYFLKQKRGRIIQISSISGINGLAGQVNYASSKAGLIGFTKALAKEVAPYGICVNAIAPGPVQTEMLEGLAGKHIDKLLGNIPLGRVCSPEEVARMVYVMADEELTPQYLTGQVIALDGGMG